MRLHWIPFVVVMVLSLVLDAVITLKLRKTGRRWLMALGKINTVVSGAVFVALVHTLVTMSLHQDDFVAHMAVGVRVLLAYFIINVPKWLWGVFYALSSLGWWNKRLSATIKTLGVAMGTICLVMMLWGTFITPRKAVVNEVNVEFDNLPQAFDGYRVVHISDAHLSTWAGDTTFIYSCVETINALHPHVVCFTGDLVSTTATEALPYVNVLSRIKARDGVYTVLGNHDYAHYMPGFTSQQQQADLDTLCHLQRAMGWTLLNNDAVVIAHDGDSIAIVGTDNYGDPPFPVYGDYGKASQGLNGVFKVHLQHNPYMWRKAIVGKTDAALTLSGHTHAMQCVIASWSPAQWRYSEWGGLYRKGNQALYVNTGLGVVGPPMRIGVAPEITLITLKKK